MKKPSSSVKLSLFFYFFLIMSDLLTSSLLSLQKIVVMVIGYDAKRAVNNLTGLGNYSRLVIEAIGRADGGKNRLLLYAPEMRPNVRLSRIKNLENVEFRFPGPIGFHGALWRSFGLTNHLRPDGVEIYHGLSNELPLNIRKSGVKSVVTFHDAIYRRLPSCYNPLDRMIYDYKYGHSCRNADMVVAISECTKRDCMELYGVPEERIKVIYQGCDDIFRREVSRTEIESLKSKLYLPQRYIVQVGTLEWRKNLSLSVRALRGVPDDVVLVAVGRDRRGYKREVMDIARSCGVDKRILFTDSLPFSDLPALYHGARASLLPSRYEGFGIPALEALECCVPFIGAKGSCLEEAGGPDSFYVNPDDADEMTHYINLILDGGEDIEKRILSGRQYARKFSTSDMADNLLACYNHVVQS